MMLKVKFIIFVGTTPTYAHYFPELSDLPIFPYQFNCYGSENSLMDCSKIINNNCHHRFLGVTCQSITSNIKSSQ